MYIGIARSQGLRASACNVLAQFAYIIQDRAYEGFKPDVLYLYEET